MDEGPMTRGEIVEAIRDHWLIEGTEWMEAIQRADQGFAFMLTEGAIREWGLTSEGEPLYEATNWTGQVVMVMLLRKGIGDGSE